MASTNASKPEWRNWYTHQTQNLARFTPHESSSLSSGTKVPRQKAFCFVGKRKAERCSRSAFSVLKVRAALLDPGVNRCGWAARRSVRIADGLPGRADTMNTDFVV